MAATQKKYLDLTGLQSLATKKALVVHPTTSATQSTGAYKISIDANGHITNIAALSTTDINAVPTSRTIAGLELSANITSSALAQALGITGAMNFIGVSTTDPTGSSGATVSGHTSWKKGDVVLYKRGTEAGYEEYIATADDNTHWELLGDADDYALKTVSISAGDGLSGGGTLAATRTISHAIPTGASADTNAALYKIKTDKFGHVTSKTAVTATNSDGAHTHSVSGTASVPADTYVTSVSTKGYTWTIDKGTSNANVASVATRGDTITYGNANVGNSVSIWGLKYSGSSPTTTTASKATAGTAISCGNADTGTKVTGVAKLGSSFTYGNANVGTGISIWGLASSEGTLTTTTASAVSGGSTKDIAKVGTAVVYGTANCKSGTTTVATRASSQTTVGNANVGSTVDGFTSSYDSTNKRLTLTPTSVTQAASSSTKIYGCGDNATIQEAVAAPNTQTLTPAVSNGTLKGSYTISSVTVPVAAEATTSFTPAASSNSTAYGCLSTSVDIIPAKATANTITPYTFADVTVPVAATAVSSFTPASSSGTTAVVCGSAVSVLKDTASISVSNPTSGAQATLAYSSGKNSATSLTVTGTAASDGSHTHGI